MTNQKIQLESKSQFDSIKQTFQSMVLKSLETKKSAIGNVAKTGRPAEVITQEIVDRMDIWFQDLMALAADNIEINGIPLNQVTEDHEPVDEQLLKEADVLQQMVQDKLVQVALLRKQIPSEIDKLNKETLEIITKNTQEAHLEFEKENYEIKQVDLDFDYSRLVREAQELKSIVPDLLDQSNQVNSLLDDLKIPLVPVKRERRRKSSMGLGLYKTSPRKAQIGLLERLEAESKKSDLYASLQHLIYVHIVYIYLLDTSFSMLAFRVIFFNLQKPLQQTQSIRFAAITIILVNAILGITHLYSPQPPSFIIDFFAREFMMPSSTYLIILEIITTMLELAIGIVLPFNTTQDTVEPHPFIRYTVLENRLLDRRVAVENLRLQDEISTLPTFELDLIEYISGVLNGMRSTGQAQSTVSSLNELRTSFRWRLMRLNSQLRRSASVLSDDRLFDPNQNSRGLPV
ncbi:hypothetical protein HDV04_004257 [Boothiomyces sp. JEL0838]|nr:hypothetical protein HDV04_004257 [Boothiomyces sp. JEL0838]